MQEKQRLSLLPCRFLVTNFFLACLLVGSGYAQKITATLTGDITDESGAVVVGAKVTAHNPSTNVERSTVTNGRGSYILEFLAAGTYDVSVELQGFKRQTFKGFVLHVNQTASLDARLEVGEVVQEVTVDAAAPLVQSTEGSVGSVIAEKQVKELPLNGRQFLQLALLVPGAIPSPGASFGGGSSKQENLRGTVSSAININGNRETSNLFLIDGTLNHDSNYNTFVISPNIDSIQEFKVQTNSYTAEFGQQSGGQINLITKSGTNSFHGTAHEFLRNSALDAKNLFDRPAPTKIPAFRQNQFGGTFGGPIRKDKTFFFGSYEGFRQVKAQTSIAIVPDAATRTGDFSSFRNAAGQLITIYDPATTQANPNFNPSLPASPSNPKYFRTPFPGNRIPADRISPIAKGILGYINLPNLPVSLPLSLSQYFNGDPQDQSNDQFSIRVDHVLSSKDQLFGRYSFSDEFIYSPGRYTRSSGVRREPKAQIATLGHTRFFTPSVVNEARIGFSRYRLNVVPQLAFTSHISRDLGIRGLEGDFGGASWDLPGIEFSGLGITPPNSPINPSRQRDNTWQLFETLSINRGSHDFRMGLQYYYFQLNEAAGSNNPSFLFRGTPFTADPANPTGAGVGSVMADFLLGTSHLNIVTTGNPQVYLRRHYLGPWFNDTWRATRNLTINLGIRWDFVPPLYEKYDRIGGVFVGGLNSPPFIPLQANKNIEGYGQVPRGVVETDKNNWAPRIGLAYRVGGSDKTVVRSGYGVFYDAEIGNTVVDWVRNFPFRIPVQVNTPNQIFPFLSLNEVLPPGSGTFGRTYLGAGQNVNNRMHFPTGAVQAWNLSVQREIMPNWSVDAAYVGSTGRHLSYAQSFNLPIAGPGTRISRQPFGSVGIDSAFHFTLPRVNSYYHALQIKSEQRGFHGLTNLMAYTFSKSIDTGQQARAAGGGGIQFQNNNFNLDGENRGRSVFDVRHRLVDSFLFELPFGKGKRYLNNGGTAGFLLGGVADELNHQPEYGLPLFGLFRCGHLQRWLRHS